jgi:hypothetical protein
MTNALHTIAGIVFIGSIGYSVYKHLTVAGIKAELAKIESEIASGVIAEEIKVVYAVFVARIKSIL